jgi:4-amino-4-deoxy-L-arabinose transferase-like glycosyltransferase
VSVLVEPPVGPPIRLPAGQNAPPERPQQGVDEALSGAPLERRHRGAWERLGVVVLLTSTAALYLWGLGASGWANAYYSAAAQAGSQSWTAWLFGASDAAGSITIDKPPAAIWVMGLSVRIFGLNSWSILVPQALMGVGAVAALTGAVRRWASPGAGLLAGAVLAVTPVAALMFRFNNPDALLVLQMTVAAYAVVRAVDGAATRWMVIAGACVGMAFLAKQLQALLVVPALAATFLVVSPLGVRRRLSALLVGGGAMALAAGWWIALVELWPAGSRPYVGGSQSNSILELTLGYNGFGRITGDEVGSVGGGGGWGATGLTRLFGDLGGGQVAWLLPAALVLSVATLWITRCAGRTDRARAGILLWGGWLLVTAVVFMWMRGIYHDYYLVAVAPAIGGLVGIGGHALWTRRDRRWVIVVLAGTIGASAWWSSALLGRATDWYPWLADLELVLGIGAAVAVLLGARAHRVLVPAGVAVGAAVALAGPAAFSIATAATPQSGAIVTAGPATAAGVGGGPGGQFGPGGGPGGGSPGTPSAGPPGGAPRGGPFGTNQQGGTPQGGPPVARTGRPVGAGGLLGATEPSADVVDALLEDADEYEWVAATVGANNAAGYQLATERSVMPVGGFNGSDPAPTLAEFQALVAAGRIHWFVAGGVGGGPGGQQGGSDEARQITEWVESSYDAVTVDGVELYDLSVEV